MGTNVYSTETVSGRNIKSSDYASIIHSTSVQFREMCYSFFLFLVEKPTDWLMNIFGKNPKYWACMKGSEEEQLPSNNKKPPPHWVKMPICHGWDQDDCKKKKKKIY